MGKEKFKRPVVAPSFTPEPSGIPLADLAQGTDGQIPVAHTGNPTAYHAVSGDATLTNAGVLTVGANKITAAKLHKFAAHNVSATGSSQNVAHGLGVIPSLVLIIPEDGGSVTYGSHDSTNVVFTGGSGKHYTILAIE
mgnify:CR=1 FL=1